MSDKEIGELRAQLKTAQQRITILEDELATAYTFVQNAYFGATLPGYTQPPVIAYLPSLALARRVLRRALNLKRQEKS